MRQKDKNNMAAAMGSEADPELLMKFAQKLAANELKTRNKALKKLRNWIEARSMGTKGTFTEEDLLKIWKGLHYCMWMCDKPLVQEELTDRIAQLIHCFKKDELALLFIDTFFKTEIREWYGIDRLRLDKFMLLMRRMLNQSFDLVRRQGWRQDLVSGLLSSLQTGPLNPDHDAIPDGVRFHVADIYLDELEKVGAAELTCEQILVFLDPYLQMLTKLTSRAVFKHVLRRVVGGVEERTETKLRREQTQTETDQEETKEEEEEEKDKPALNLDCTRLADRLFEAASAPTCISKNRGKLYLHVKRLRNLAAGRLPKPLVYDVGRVDVSKTDIHLAVNRLDQLEAKLNQSTAKARKERMRKKKLKRRNEGDADADADAASQEEDDGAAPPAKKKRKKKPHPSAAGDEDTSSGSDKENGGHVMKNAETSKEKSEATTSAEKKKKKKNKTNKEEKTAEEFTELKMKNSGRDEVSLFSGGFEDSGEEASQQKVKVKAAKKGKRKSLTPVTDADDVEDVGKVSEVPEESGIESLGDAQVDVNAVFQATVKPSSEKTQKVKSMDAIGSTKKAESGRASKVKSNNTAVKRPKAPQAGPEVNLFQGGFFDSDEEQSEQTTAKKSKGKKSRRKSAGVAMLEDPSKETLCTDRKRRKSAAADLAVTSHESLVMVNGDIATQHPGAEVTSDDVTTIETPSDGKKGKKQKQKGQSEGHGTPSPTPPGATVLEEEVEIFIPNKKYKGPAKVNAVGDGSGSKKAFATFDKVMATPPAFVKRAMNKVNKTPKTEPKKGSEKIVTDSLTPSSAKKTVKFVMARNKTQEFRKTSYVSPQPAFNPQHLPEQGILKSPATPVAKATDSPRRALLKKKRRSSASDFF